MISIDNRLKVCADMVSGNGIVCDIGTDHAYLPVYLVQNNICKKVVAADISDGPLEYAKQTVNKFECQDSIQIKKSDGLKSLDLENVSDIVIAGMGGETIARIIGKEKRSLKGINLILQPMTRSEQLRKWLYKSGFEIISEEAVVCDNFIYSVINAVFTGVKINIGINAEFMGKINPQTEAGKKYFEHHFKKFSRVANGLTKAKETVRSNYYKNVANSFDKMIKGEKYMVSEIYNYLNDIAPFSTQEKWDNSGLLTGNMTQKTDKVLVCLDITNDVVDEAIELGIDLVISHHPVIFHPLYNISDDEPVCRLWKKGIAAICTHTPFDVAKNGMSDILMELAGFSKVNGIIEITGCNEESYGFGTVGIADTEYTAEQLASKLKDVLECTVVKYNEGSKSIKKAAFCTGSGGNLIEEVIKLGVDAYITAEVKHDQWIMAKRKGIAVFDCGHYHTEVIGMKKLCKMLETEFVNIEFVFSQADKDPVKYVL